MICGAVTKLPRVDSATAYDGHGFAVLVASLCGYDE